MCVTWLSHMCHMTYSYVRHDLFIYATLLIPMCHMTDSYGWQNSFICATWLNFFCDMTHSLENFWRLSLAKPRTRARRRERGKQRKRAQQEQSKGKKDGRERVRGTERGQKDSWHEVSVSCEKERRVEREGCSGANSDFFLVKDSFTPKKRFYNVSSLAIMATPYVVATSSMLPEFSNLFRLPQKSPVSTGLLFLQDSWQHRTSKKGQE